MSTFASGPAHAQLAQTDDWQTTSPAAAGFAPDLAERLDAAVKRGELANLHAVIVVRRGKLVLERYFAGRDDRRGAPLGVVTFGPEVKHDLRSVSKSIVGLLYGIALAERRVPAVDQPILDQFPAYADLAADPQRRRLTIAHVLSMTLGTEWDETLPYTSPRNSEIAMEMAPHMLRFVLDRPIVAEPGSRWTYNGGCTALIGHLIAEGTGTVLTDFARDKLFARSASTTGNGSLPPTVSHQRPLASGCGRAISPRSVSSCWIAAAGAAGSSCPPTGWTPRSRRARSRRMGLTTAISGGWGKCPAGNPGSPVLAMAVSA